MKISEKKMLSAAAVILLIAALFAHTSSEPFLPSAKEEKITARSVLKKEPITVWYEGEENRNFFESCARDFERKKGIHVTLKECKEQDYFDEIYEAVKEGENFPDAYLLSADHLKQAYFSQILEPNPYAKNYADGYAKNAIEASSVDGVMYGYPLYFNTTLFAYRTDYFENEPTSLQQVLDYATEHEPGEGVEKLFEWDLSDGYVNFAFFGEALSLEEEADGMLNETYDEEKYEAHKTFFGNLTAAISLDSNTINSETIETDFKKGKTVAAMIDSDNRKHIKGVKYKMGTLPSLNDEHTMKAAARTELLCVNAMSEKKEAAEEFASFATIKEAKKLGRLTEHVSVCEEALSTADEKTAFEQYEKAQLLPDALDAADFWVRFQNEVIRIWNE